jgi:hypothetical protein
MKMRKQLKMTNDKLKMTNYESEKISTVAKFATITTHNVIRGNLKSHFVILSQYGGRKTLPFAFTKQGVSSLSGMLKSETAVKSISIKKVQITTNN